MDTRIFSVTVVALLLATGFGPVGVAAGATGGSGTVASANATCAFPLTKTDATGTSVTVESAPKTVVTLGPSAAQTMWDIGAKGKVVGLTKYATYLDGANSRTNVSGSALGQVDVETVVNSSADLVLAPNIVPDQTVQKLRDAGLTVYKFGPATSIQDVYAKTLLTGRLTGECAGATQAVQQMKDRIATVRQAVNGTGRPDVLYVIGGYTAGKGTFIDQIITTAGGRNVAAANNITGYKEISDEVVVASNPQWIVLNSGVPSVPDSKAYASTTAVRKNQTVVLNANYVSQPAPRIVRPIVKLARTLHPEAYASANATATPTGDATTQTATSEPTTASTTSAPGQTTTTGSQPGFGVLAALGALGVVGLLSRRP